MRGVKLHNAWCQTCFLFFAVVPNWAGSGDHDGSPLEGCCESLRRFATYRRLCKLRPVEYTIAPDATSSTSIHQVPGLVDLSKNCVLSFR